MKLVGRYCLDTNVLIQAKNSYYSFRFAPQFWEWLDTEYKRGRIYSSTLVCNELIKGKDRLAEWAKQRRHSGFFEQPGKKGQEAYREVARYVSERYPQHQYAEFLRGADAWVIAQAKANATKLVTMEKPAGESAKRIKIPDVAAALDVESVDFFKMLMDLDFKMT